MSCTYVFNVCMFFGWGLQAIVHARTYVRTHARNYARTHTTSHVTRTHARTHARNRVDVELVLTMVEIVPLLMVWFLIDLGS